MSSFKKSLLVIVGLLVRIVAMATLLPRVGRGRSWIMRINFAGRRLITIASVLLTLSLTQLSAQAQGGQIEVLSYAFGCTVGEKVRFTVSNKTNSEQSIHVGLKVFDQEGNQIAQRQGIVPPSRFGYLEVDRDELSLRGEPTGRLQMLAKLFLIWDSANPSGAPPPVKPGQWLFDVSVEVINKSTGETVVFTSAIDADPPILDLFKNDFVFGVELPSFGLTHGQEVRFSLFNTDSEQPLKAVLKISDAEGNRLTQRETVVPANGFNYVKIRREDFSELGESPTGRLQLQGAFTLTFNGQTTAGLPRLIPGSLEIVQDGKTVAIGLLLPIVQRERCTLPPAQCP